MNQLQIALVHKQRCEINIKLKEFRAANFNISKAITIINKENFVQDETLNDKNLNTLK